jgi:hypothetical protein
VALFLSRVSFTLSCVALFLSRMSFTLSCVSFTLSPMSFTLSCVSFILSPVSFTLSRRSLLLSCEWGDGSLSCLEGKAQNRAPMGPSVLHPESTNQPSEPHPKQVLYSRQEL